MTSQMEQLIEDIRFNFNEDDSVILKTYIERLEQQNKELQARIKQLEEVHEKYGNAILELRKKVKELQEPKKCFDCKDKYDCYSYGTLTEDQTYMLSCPLYEPKEN